MADEIIVGQKAPAHEANRPQALCQDAEKWLPGLALLLMVVALLAVWQISTVSFKPAEGSIDLSAVSKTRIYLDSGQCPASIKDRLVMENIVDETLQTLLWSCVEDIRSVPGNERGSVTLPHEWRSDLRVAANTMMGRVLYSMDYDVVYWPPGGVGQWSVSFTGAGHNLAVFLNGKLLGWSGSFEIPVARNHSRPMLFTIPDGILKEGNNRFDVYVASEFPVEGFLGQAYLAPSEMLRPAQRFFHFFRFNAPQVIALSTIVLSGLMVLLWVYRRQDVEYGLFGLIGFFWSVHTLDQVIIDIPLPTVYWHWLIQVSLGALMVCNILFMHRFLKLSLPRLEKGLLIGSGLLALGLLIMADTAGFYRLLQWLWNPLILLGALYVLVNALLRLREQPDLELYALTTAMAIIFLLLCYDQMLLSGLLPVYEGRLLHFGAPFLLLAFTWILLRRFVKSLSKAEQYNAELRTLNHELEARVEEKSQRIAQSYEMIRQFGQEQVVQQERSRIMRDMHDGIGVYLTSMLRQLEHDSLDRQHLQDSAHNALNDLRLMIDSLGSASGDLPAMLGMFRTRISALLEACQVELEWQVDELPVLDDFGPERALNLLRILQEAITNALKHSGASRIYLSATAETSAASGGHILIRVKDNGGGFAPVIEETEGTRKTGNGLNNMRHRARKIKAEFFIDATAKGTGISILLPVSVQDDSPITPAQKQTENNKQPVLN